MKKYIGLSAGIALSLLMLILTVRLVRAQTDIPMRGPTHPEAVTSRSSYIPIQGRLTDSDGIPLDGSFDMTFHIYDAWVGGTALCNSSQPGVPVESGLFVAYMDMGGCSAIDGRQLYLGIQVGSDAEMSPRQFIDNVPYAWTLRPGANISATIGGDAVLDIDNYSSTGRGLRAEAQAASGINYAVLGAARSPSGYGGYFYNNGGGTGLYGQSDTGAAIVAAGSGVFKSSAQSVVWVSGNGIRSSLQADSTIIDMNDHGGARVYRGADPGTKNVMLPITAPGVLYGQNVRVSDLDIYYFTNTSSDYITAVLMRRQTGGCPTCYADVLYDSLDHKCSSDPTGCVVHYPLSTNNILSADSGVLYLTIELAFLDNTTWIDISGIRLTLEHD